MIMTKRSDGKGRAGIYAAYLKRKINTAVSKSLAAVFLRLFQECGEPRLS